MKTIDRNWDKTTFADIMSPAKIVLCGSRQDLPVLSITMRGGIVEQKERFKKVIASHDTSKYKVVKNGQLVIAFPIDEGLIYTQDVADEGIMSPAYNVWDVNYENFDRRFLGLYFHSPFAMAYYKNNLRGTTQRRRTLPKEVLLSMPIPKPSLSKQKEIISELDGIASIISLLQTQVAELDLLIESIFYDIFGSPAINPKGWDMIKLGEGFSHIKNGANIKQEKGASGLPITRIETLSGGVFNRDRLGYANVFEVEKYSNYIMDDGDILLSHINSKANIGRAVVYIKQENEIIIHGMNLLRMKVIPTLLNPIFINIFFKTDYFRDKISKIRKDAVNQSSISITDLKNIDIYIPPLSLQKTFATRVQAIEDSKSVLKAQVNEVENLLEARMQYWFD